MAVEIVAPVPAGTPEPLALDEPAKPAEDRRPLRPFRSERRRQVDTRDQEEGGRLASFRYRCCFACRKACASLSKLSTETSM
jgi:hypothetical protein